jgi:hypothetical protein
MPYYVHFEYRYTVLTLVDPCAPGDWLAVLEDVLPRAATPLKLLVDARSAPGVTVLSPDAMTAYFELRAKRLEHGLAAVVVSNDAQFEWARTLERRTRLRGVNLEICGFRDWTAALLWLEDTRPEH